LRGAYCCQSVCFAARSLSQLGPRPSRGWTWVAIGAPSLLRAQRSPSGGCVLWVGSRGSPSRAHSAPGPHTPSPWRLSVRLRRGQRSSRTCRRSSGGPRPRRSPNTLALPRGGRNSGTAAGVRLSWDEGHGRSHRHDSGPGKPSSGVRGDSRLTGSPQGHQRAIAQCFCRSSLQRIGSTSPARSIPDAVPL